ncbi:alpha/beta hydrolase [Rhizobacter sp. J219]|jgi:pimeloyl-ACP methyl ester carboxylesterase|uniref:alpha/beta fold hydrolase n=1 Tax=Rhizobacter sp. J219 TaxID=2898430 RepID=UPI002151AF12|nr:alpha/beta hydrolase [Rhizobacter sp. J219]MCR5884444.1 alpha/beta hydrolase [Rhizobacter sp. J219]
MSVAVPLVLLPGLLCDRAVWAPQIEGLRHLAECHVAHYGLLDSLGAMARHVLDTVPAERFALAGHSMGGRVAFEVWRQAPGRVTHLALLDTSYHPLAPGEAGENERLGRHTLLDKARREGMRAMADEWARGMVHESRIGGPVFAAILDMFERSTPEVFGAQIKALLDRPDADPLLPTITCPTLVLCGRDDAWSPPARHEHLQARIAGSRLVVVERCGHMSTMEQPEAVTQAFARWLSAD